MLDAFETSSKSEPYVAIFSPLEHPQQGLSVSDRVEGLPTESQAARATPAKRKRRAWAPDADDHLIYRWAKVDCKGQEFVAQCFGISQSTVSRIVERYERWQAHAEERDDGRLDPAERLRAQRWLAFERNEAMITSCLRLAGEMEGFKNVSKSVTRRPVDSPSQESDVRTEWSVLDRTGMAARFLRLAFRINLEQLRLAEAAPAPRPEPLSEEEIAEQETLAAEERAEIAAVRQRGEQELSATQMSLMDQLQAARHEPAQARREAAAAREEAEEPRRQLALAGVTAELPRRERSTNEPATEAERPAYEPAEERFMHSMHNLHTEKGAESAVSACSSEVCIAPAAEREFAAPSVHGLPNRCLDDDSIVSAKCQHDAVGACTGSLLPMLARTTAGP